MFLFPFMPVPIALILLILVIAMGLYYNFYIKLNKFETNKLEVIENQIMKITNMLLIYIIIMAMFRNDGEAKFYIGYFGINISLVLFYISLVGAYLNLMEERKVVNKKEGLDFNFSNHKILYYLIVATIVMRFSFNAYFSSSSTSILRMLIIFILLCLAQYELNKNLKPYYNEQVHSIRDIINKNNLKKNIALGLVLIIIVSFTSRKYFLSPKEKKMKKYDMEYDNMMNELFG
ncbi:hypothetical protein P5F43_10615 [Clostridium perfringens]|nr:hypothetical protein [Clostridium perfringens]MDK0878805.1 hypothetical protein [Clostridium perfringens]MDK0887452.1 hypothetical protein [Clostridium perfringens]